MIQNYCFLIVAIAVVLVLCSLSLTIKYQHMRVRESIVARAQRMGYKDVKKLEASLDEMMGPDLRSLGSATDAEFVKRLKEIFAE